MYGNPVPFMCVQAKFMTASHLQTRYNDWPKTKLHMIHYAHHLPQ
jgi:hypothetical protein